MAGAEEFVERTHFLESEVGDGGITAGCLVDQPYAQDQHETFYQHPRGGRMNYLGGPLMENATDLVQHVANNVITEYGSDLHDAMKDVAREMAYEYVLNEAPLGPPIDEYILRLSGSPYLIEDGVETWRVPAVSDRDPNDTHNWDTA